VEFERRMNAEVRRQEKLGMVEKRDFRREESLDVTSHSDHIYPNLQIISSFSSVLPILFQCELHTFILS